MRETGKLKTRARFAVVYAHHRLELPRQHVVKLGKGSDQKPATFFQPACCLLSLSGGMEDPLPNIWALHEQDAHASLELQWTLGRGWGGRGGKDDSSWQHYPLLFLLEGPDLDFFFNFSNIFNVPLNRKQLDSNICFCIVYCEMLFWLKYLKKVWPHTYKQLYYRGIFYHLFREMLLILILLAECGPCFLQKNEIMGYSVFLKIQKRNRSLSTAPSRSLCFHTAPKTYSMFVDSFSFSHWRRSSAHLQLPYKALNHKAQLNKT